MALTESKEEYLGSLQCFFVGINVFGVATRPCMGAIVLTDLKLIVIGWATMLAGTFLGLRVFRKLDTAVFKKVIYIFVGLNGVYTVLTHLP